MNRPRTQDLAALLVAAACAASSVTASAQAYLDEALAFIASRMNVQQWRTERVKNHRWKPSNVKLPLHGVWTWDEAKEEWSPDSRKVVIESYSVDPTLLAAPVRAGKHSITFECRVSSCIKVIGSSVTTAADGAPKQAAIDVEKRRNTWFLANAGEARRVAQAMNRALTLLGVKERAL